jgi:hypothetical protein
VARGPRVVRRRDDLHRRDVQERVKVTFCQAGRPWDPSGLFNSRGNTRRAIDFFEGEKINEKAFKTLVRAAVTLNKSKA